jgi:hypothetical protein
VVSLSNHESQALRQALKNQLFCAYNINYLQADKKIKNRRKQRLFLVDAMRPKGAYFAQGERLSRLKWVAGNSAQFSL